jgi:hypothetical protein
MRRRTLRVTRATSVIAAAAVLSASSAPSAMGAPALTLFPTQEHQARVVSKASGKPGRVWAYWGSLSTGPRGARVPWGRYRATCTWIAPANTSDNRLTCIVVLAAQAVPGPILVAEGLVRMPRERKDTGLFDRAAECSSLPPRPPAKCAPRKLAITGGTGAYRGWSSYVLTVSETLAQGVTITIEPT